MLNKNTSLFLAITAWLSCLLIIIFRLIHVMDSQREESIPLLSWISFFVFLLNYFAIGLFGYTSYTNRETAQRVSAVFLIVSSCFLLVYHLFELYEYPVTGEQLSDLQGFVSFLRFTTFQYLPPVAFLLLGIAFLGTNVKRKKRALYWSLIAGFYLLLSDTSTIIFGLIYQINFAIEGLTSSFSTLRLVLELFFVPFSIALILFSMRNYNSLQENKGDDFLEKEHLTDNEQLLDKVEKIDKWGKIKTPQTLSTFQWLANFMLSAIPLAGPILLIIWGNDHQNRIRRNWAIMQFWGVTIGFGLNLFLLSQFAGPLDELALSLSVLGFLLLTMFIAAIILTYNYSQHKSDFEDDQNPTLGTWLANFVIVGIPIVGLIMLIVWATDSTKELIRKWAAARLIWIAVSIMIWVFIYNIYDQIRIIIPFAELEF